MQQILVEGSAIPQCLVWRQNVGLAVPLRLAVQGDLTPIKFGVEGQADIGGCYRGICIQVETKSRTGKQREAQEAWQKATERAGGVYMMPRTMEDFRAGLKRIDEELDQGWRR